MESTRNTDPTGASSDDLSALAWVHDELRRSLDAAHKALLRIWALVGVQAADEALMDVSIPLVDSDDTQRALHSKTHWKD